MNIRHRLAVALLLSVTMLTLPALAISVYGQGTWETTLQARDLNGDGDADAYYDTDLDITWLRDWNVNGRQDWDVQVAWASTLNVHGITGWRLPQSFDAGEDGCNNFGHAGGTDCGYNVDTSTDEMAHLFYVTLGNKGYCPPGDTSCAGGPQPGYGLTNTANFNAMQGDQDAFYWSGTFVPPLTDPTYNNTLHVWSFHMKYGDLDVVPVGASGGWLAAAVHDGDVSPVPLPAAAWLLLSGLGAMGLLARRRSSQDTSD